MEHTLDYTPGPWEWGQCLTTPKNRAIRYYVNAKDDESTRICDTPKATWNGREGANARLIAAAPELLEALEEALCWIPDGSRKTPEQRGARCETAYDADAMINAAIARARGAA